MNPLKQLTEAVHMIDRAELSYSERAARLRKVAQAIDRYLVRIRTTMVVATDPSRKAALAKANEYLVGLKRSVQRLGSEPTP